MECTYVKENLLKTRNNLLYPELAKLFKQLLSVKTISALRLQALQSDRKGYDDIDFFRDLYTIMFSSFLHNIKPRFQTYQLNIHLFITNGRLRIKTIKQPLIKIPEKMVVQIE